MSEIRILEYLDSLGRSPFAGWVERLNASAAAKVTAPRENDWLTIGDETIPRIERMHHGTHTRI
ncbi:MAG: hypothetical protein P0121_01470 [Nitrospira sp.]|nr:hypothetical protein [Nitrospira sp.]